MSTIVVAGRPVAGRSSRVRARRLQPAMRPLRPTLLAVLIALLVPAAAHAAPEPGINLGLPFSTADVQNVKDCGAKAARFFMFYDATPPGGFDGPVAQLKSIGVPPLFVGAS